VEERLEAELAPPPLDPNADRHVDLRFDLPRGEFQAELPLGHPRPGNAGDVEKLSEEDAIVELATLRLERACRDVIDDARAEALMSRIVRDRDEVFGDPFDHPSAPSSGPHSGPPPANVTIPPATSFTRLLSARRLAYAAGAIALLAAVPLALGGNPAHWLQRTAAHDAGDGGSEAAAVASAVEWRRLPVDQAKEALAAGLATAENRGWQVNLVERLARQAIPVGEGRGAKAIEGSSLEASLQDWQGRAKSLQSAENQLARADGVSLAVATVADDVANAGGPDDRLVQVVRNSALVDSVVHLDANGEAKAKALTQQAGSSAKTEAVKTEAARTETVALASPRPEDVLAAATAREVERKAQRKAAGEAKPEPRDPAKVELALAAAPGLAELKSSQRKDIATRLSKGECLATTLKDYFSPVPVLLMRDLVRDLDSEC
jgi:hypothetical protein